MLPAPTGRWPWASEIRRPARDRPSPGNHLGAERAPVQTPRTVIARMRKISSFTLKSSRYWSCALLALTFTLLAANYYVLVSMRQDILAKEERQLRRVADAT